MHEQVWDDHENRGPDEIFICWTAHQLADTRGCWRRGPADGGWVCLNVPLLLCLGSLWSSSNLQLSGTHFPHLTDLWIISRLRCRATGRRGVRRNVEGNPTFSSITITFCLIVASFAASRMFKRHGNEIDLDFNKPTHTYPQDNRNRYTAFKDHCGNFAYLTFTHSGSGVFSQLQ